MDNSLLQLIADNEALMASLKAALLKHFDLEDDIGRMKLETSDEVIGQIARANISGRQKIENAFREISQYKSAPPPVDNVNPGR